MARIALGQLNLTVGDLDGNVARMADAAAARHRGRRRPDLLPRTRDHRLPARGPGARDASSSTTTWRRCRTWRERPRRGCAVVAGSSTDPTPGIHNAAALPAARATSQARYHKIQLPNFGVFDERALLHAGHRRRVAWNVGGAPSWACRSARTPGTTACRSRATPALPLIVNINGSPYHRGKTGERDDDPARARAADRCLDRLRERGRRPGRAGLRRRLDGDGARRRGAHRAAMFDEDLLIVDIHGDVVVRRTTAPRVARPARRRSTAPSSLGLGDYVRKNGFADGRARARRAGSTRRWSATLAVDALGRRRRPRRSRCPRRTRRPRAWRTPMDCAHAARASASTRSPIDDVFDAYRFALAELFAGHAGGRGRGEPPGARARQPADGAVEQVRLDRARDRQQDASTRWATPRSTATWRAGSRPSRTCPRRSSTSSPPGATPGRACGDTPPIPERTIDEAAERRAPSGPEGHRLAAAVRRARPGDRGLRRGRPGRRRDGEPGHRARPRRARGRAWSTAPSTSAGRPPRA